eukprot:2953230-Ditylum_brightwellii.AAC.1
MEEAASDQKSPTLYLALAKTKLMAKDKAGAMTATIQALKVASEKEDVEKANLFLEELLLDLSEEGTTPAKSEE